MTKIQRFFASISVLWCLPWGCTDPAPLQRGTVMRSATLRRYASEAGTAGGLVLPIEHPLFRFYRLIP